jgi:purine nucleosidase
VRPYRLQEAPETTERPGVRSHDGGVRVHLDTDLGSNPDDAAALVALLGRGEVDLVGVTTNLEVAGRRAGCVRHYLRLAGREDVPVAAGAPPRGELPERYLPTWGDARFWPDPVEPAPGAVGAALDLLDASIGAGATVCTIGALTNLARLERRQPGRLRGVRVVTLGGCVDAFADDLPPWGPERDVNLQADRAAAAVVLDAAADLTLVQLPAAIRAQLRERDLDRLRRAGAIGDLLARQVLAHRARVGIDRLAAAFPGLADDLVGILWDPVAAAVAVEWSGVDVARRRLRVVTDGDGPGEDRGDADDSGAGDARGLGGLSGGVLLVLEDPAGAPVDVVTRVDGEAFVDWWLTSVEAAHTRSSS